MSDEKRYYLNPDDFPSHWPTHRHMRKFWESLGRVVATYGFLEEVLVKAIGVLEASLSSHAKGPEEWLSIMEKILPQSLKQLADRYGQALRFHHKRYIEDSYLDKLVSNIKKAAETRNVICHASWSSPDEEGCSKPFFVDREMRKFDTPIDFSYLEQVQIHVAELAVAIINTVTVMGYQFPGSGGPGKPITEILSLVPSPPKNT